MKSGPRQACDRRGWLVRCGRLAAWGATGWLTAALTLRAARGKCAAKSKTPVCQTCSLIARCDLPEVDWTRQQEDRRLR